MMGVMKAESWYRCEGFYFFFRRFDSGFWLLGMLAHGDSWGWYFRYTTIRNIRGTHLLVFFGHSLYYFNVPGTEPWAISFLLHYKVSPGPLLMCNWVGGWVGQSGWRERAPFSPSPFSSSNPGGPLCIIGSISFHSGLRCLYWLA